MARRIKEEAGIHRSRIADATSRLIVENGIENVSVDDIAKESGYSKATIYVYFESKDEILNYLTLESMLKLKEYLISGIKKGTTVKEMHNELVMAIFRYAEEYPFHFKKVLEPISVDYASSDFNEIDREIFLVGEEINKIIGEFIQFGIDRNEFKDGLNSSSFIFAIWGMISGVVQTGISKRKYLNHVAHTSLEEFITMGCDIIYDGIKK